MRRVTPVAGAARTETVERHGRRARRLHAATWLVGLPLIATGWWISLGGEGHPSPLARLIGLGDTALHLWLGRAFAVLLILPLVVGRRGVATFLRETFRIDRGDLRWWRRLPIAALTGRFARHEGEFDPGQRVANVVIVGGFCVLTGTGLALGGVHGGPTYVWLHRIHVVTAIVVTIAVLGHLLVVAGVLPGYRGVWRSIHLGGRVRLDVARRLWPGSLERRSVASGAKAPTGVADQRSLRSDDDRVAPVRRSGRASGG